MVDWSAASAPKTGKDSVWWCLCVWRGGRLVMEANENSPTRQLCFDVLRTQLRTLVAEGSLARTVAECFRFRNKIGLDVALEALTNAWRSKRLKLDELTQIARKLRIQRVMQPYLDTIVM